MSRPNVLTNVLTICDNSYMNTNTITAAGRVYTLTETDGRQVLVNSRGRATAHVSFNARGEVLVLPAGASLFPGGWSERDWNHVCNELEMMVVT